MGEGLVTIVRMLTRTLARACVVGSGVRNFSDAPRRSNSVNNAERNVLCIHPGGSVYLFTPLR